MVKSAHIALLANEYIDYPKVLVDNIISECAQYGYGVICVTGRELNPRPKFDQNYAHCNNIYKLLHGSDTAGIISLSGTLGSNVTLSVLNGFLEQFQVPKVSIGIELPAIDCVVVEDSAGMRSLMQHLVDDTDAEKFAFVKGFANDPYSKLRETIFREVLAENSLQVKNEWVLHGNYDPLETYAAVSRLLRNNPKEIDAIVAANDLMALSAARAVRSRGLKIPDDVLITGFDDTEEATKHSPALTTVRQPLRELARVSVELLHEQISASSNLHSCDQLQSKTLQSRTRRICSELIIRGSTYSKRLCDLPKPSDSLQLLLHELHRALSDTDIPSRVDISRLMDALSETLTTGSDQFGNELKHLLSTTLEIDHLHWWNTFCFQMEYMTKRHTAGYAHEQCSQQSVGKGDKSKSIFVRSMQKNYLPLISDVLVHVKEQLWQLAMDREYEIQRLGLAQASMQLEISSCTELDDVISTLERWLDNINPQRCFLIRYETPGPIPDKYAELIYAKIGSERLLAEYAPFRSNKILPIDLREQLRQGLLVLHPAFAGDQHFGYLLLDPRGLPSIDMFRTALSIGNALRNQFLIGKLEDNASKLEQANQELVQLATIDVLTQLPNRYCFQTELEKHCEIANSEFSALSIFFIDLDGFKSVNDNFGHNAGDQLLQNVAKRLRSVVAHQTKGFALIARLGGDEFTIMLPHSQLDEFQSSLSIALIEAIAQTMIIGGKKVFVSASIGFATQQGPHVCADSLLRQADAAMYQAKKQGKNQYCQYA